MTKKLKINRFFAVLLVAAISLCFFAFPVRAETMTNDNDPLNIDTNVTYRLEDYSEAVEVPNLIEDVFESDNIAMLSADDNTAPVAGLTIMFSNPESLVNNKVSTDTVIFWLWKDGDEYLTYDPDGNTEISEFHIEGISEYIIGYVTSGDETVGFATKITVPAEHFMKYYVVDTYGSVSNVLSYRIEVEPTDGSHRPECAISASNTTSFAGEKVYFDCAPSTDADGDAIESFRIKIIAGNKEFTSSDNPYFLGISGTVATVKFDEPGTYGVRFAVKDNRGAWSNWVGDDFVVTERGATDEIANLGVDWVGTKTVRWTEENTTATHTMTSRLSTVKVYPNRREILRSYTNFRGKYKNVIAYPVAPGTHFLSFESQRSQDKGDFTDGTDPFFGLPSGRALTLEEINEINDSSRWEGYIYIIYDANSNSIIDFYCPLNPIIGRFWDFPVLER